MKLNYNDKKAHAPQQYGKRSERVLAKQNRARLAKMLELPSSYAVLQAPSGRTTQKQYLIDCFRLMDLLVSEMCFVSRKVGVSTKNGFLLRTWNYVSEKLNLPLWRVKQCLTWCYKKGWLTSDQPRELYTDEKGNVAYKGLASIKRITLKYFQDIGLHDEFKTACKAAREAINKLANKLNTKVKILLTPITMLQRFARKAANLMLSNTDDINSKLDRLEASIFIT